MSFRTELRTVQVDARGPLLPPIASARRRLVDRLKKADQQLDDARKITSALHGFLAGPRSYLVLSAATMRRCGRCRSPAPLDA